MAYDPATSALRKEIETGSTDHGEEIISNGKQGEARISICVPTWKDGADALFASLIRLPGAEQCTLLVYDDGSADSDLTRQLTRQIRRFPSPARLISAHANKGRSQARNRLMAFAESDWILFLDADMQPDDDAFLTRYLEAVETAVKPALLVGGVSLKHAVPTEQTRLHAAQAQASECLPASARSKAPGRYVFTANLLVHREILQSVTFDAAFQGWGWEDVDWGLRVADQFEVRHIDNAATHLGLDTDQALIAKYAGSASNFQRLIERHQDEMERTALYRLSKRLRHVPVRAQIERWSCQIAQVRWLPIKLRLFALKLFRAAVYGGRI